MALTDSSHSHSQANHHLSSHAALCTTTTTSSSSSTDNDFSSEPVYTDLADSTLSSSSSAGEEPPPLPLPLVSASPSVLARGLSSASSPSKLRPPTKSAAAKTNRTGLFTLAALARDKTSSAIATLTQDPAIRQRPSSTNLSRQSTISPGSPPSLKGGGAFDEQDYNQYARPGLHRGPSSGLSQATTLHSRASTTSDSSVRQPSLLETSPPSQAHDDTDSNSPSPPQRIPASPGNYNKMHQTSSRLLRMTDDERPFTRDFKDLFSTLVVSLPLAVHRVRLTRVDHSFVSEEAINNLGSLKFSQSNRMPDPKDPSRIVTTTTTTTFSMAREMARSVCQRFLEARFIESADGKQAKEFNMKGSVWQLTPKGIHILDRFCSKNGIQQKHIADLVNSSKNTMQLVILERDSATDKLSADRSTVEVIFRRFIGQNGPNVKSTPSAADSDSLSDYKDGIAGVKMAAERKVGSPPRTFREPTFTGKAATDWLMDCCTTVDRRETTELASLFIDQGLIECVQADKPSYSGSLSPGSLEQRFQPTKTAIYKLTSHGTDVVNMTNRERSSNGGEDPTPAPRPGVSRDSNTQKLDKILNDAALRLLFRENLRDTHCEENLSFYLDVDEFLKSCKSAIKGAASSRPGKSGQTLDAVKETMASAYGIYNAFLAPGSPCELNIDHLLRNQLATRMTKAVGQDGAMIDSLREVTKLFEEAQISVFKLMASDSVPKFMKSAKYEQTLKNYDFDAINSSGSSGQQRYNAPVERSMSKSTR